MSIASIFNPQDDSLESKVNATKQVQQSMDDIQASMDHSNSKGYDSAIGMQDELKDAYTVTSNSHKRALQSLTEKDLQTARNQKLISDNEYAKFARQKNRFSIEQARSTSKSKNKDLGKSI